MGNNLFSEKVLGDPRNVIATKESCGKFDDRNPCFHLIIHVFLVGQICGLLEDL